MGGLAKEKAEKILLTKLILEHWLLSIYKGGCYGRIRGSTEGKTV